VIDKPAGLDSGAALTLGGAWAQTPAGRLMELHELLRLRMIDSRDFHLLLGASPETAPAAGTYVDWPEPECEPCPCCGREP
jgi:hypothetical protein